MPGSKLQIVDLNPYLSCILCGGYFIDATTITECVHSFCRACIVRFLETSKYCPVCEVQVHKSRPLHYIRSDKTLQDIVYKLVPGLFQNEMKRRRELYASQPPEAIKESRDAEDRGECLEEKFIYAPDELFSLSVEYGCEVINHESSAESDDSLPKKRFLLCPAAITISHLMKFIRMKYGIPNTYQVVLQYDKESLREDYTLMDIAYIFLWERKGPMRFFYKIIERPPKIIKPSVNLQETDIKTSDAMDASKSEDKLETGDLKEDIPKISSETKVIPSTLPQVEEKCPVTSIKVKCDLEKTVVVEEADTKKEVSNKSLKIEVVEKKETIADSASSTNACPKKEAKVTTTLKFLPTSCSKSSCSESKPAVMTVAPLTKPSTSMATTTSTTASTGTITHGLYTGISIKKSPPNTLPPFRISSHLLAPPRVPPLKLSPPRFSKLESCLRQMTPKETSSKKSSSHSKKSKSSKSSSDKLESKVAQLKSASIKSIAPLVISVSQETKTESRNTQDSSSTVTAEEKPAETPQSKPPKEETSTAAVAPDTASTQDTKLSMDDDKMDLDNDIFEGPLVIAEPDPLPKDDSEDSIDDKPTVSATTTTTNGSKVLEEDPEDEEIDVVDDGEADSGRGSDISSRAEARSLSGDDDLGSPESVPKTPESEQHPQPISIPKPPTKFESSSEPKAKIAKCNGVATNSNSVLPSPNASSSDNGVLDLSTCSRKRNHEGESLLTHRSKQVANPAVLDKSRQTPCRSPELQSFKAISSPVLPPLNTHPYKIKTENNGRNNFKCRGSNLTVINSEPNGNIPKIVIRKLGPRPSDRGGHERFHHHHNHNHHHHHQRMYPNSEGKCVFQNKTKLLG